MGTTNGDGRLPLDPYLRVARRHEAARADPESVAQEAAAIAAREAEGRAREVQAAVDKLAATLGKRYAPEKVRLDDYRVYLPARQQPVLDRVRKIEAEIATFLTYRPGLIFYGDTGTGKDYFLAALLYAVVRAGVTCGWIGARQLAGTEKVVAARIDAAAVPHVLGFSDPIPPAGMPAMWHLERFYDLLDRRDRNEKLTWATLNAASKKAAEKALTAAVWSRLAQRLVPIPCFWPDYRARSIRGENPRCHSTDATANTTAPTTAPRATSPPPPK